MWSISGEDKPISFDVHRLNSGFFEEIEVHRHLVENLYFTMISWGVEFGLIDEY